MSQKNAPPGWKPHEISHRIDGWVIDPEDEMRIPSAVAELIARAMPQLGGGNSIADIRARMVARQRAHEERTRRYRYG
jgi:hypothetical protein